MAKGPGRARSFLDGVLKSPGNYARLTPMTTLAERLDTDYKTALKAGERRRVDTIRMAKAAMQRVALDKRKDHLDEQEVIQVLVNQAKLRRETIESAKKAGRPEIAQEADEELTILSAYLPQPPSEDDIKRLVEEAIQQFGPSQGPIMKFVMGKTAGSVDGKLVSQLVAQRLQRT